MRSLLASLRPFRGLRAVASSQNAMLYIAVFASLLLFSTASNPIYIEEKLELPISRLANREH